ncbi:hypothetical protein P12x_003033 [Tundrisphaera lichenicola]|uniref:hypothetical protein n=1 Tax=Tundrisphaera lichenicola TaxID=2029860 RepID=UPI003EBC3BF0
MNDQTPSKTKAEDFDISEFDEMIPLAIKLQDRCNTAGIKIEFFTDKEFMSGPYAVVTLESGRKERKLSLSSESEFTKFLGAKFESITPLAGYEALLNRDTQTIEAAITNLGSNQRNLVYTLAEGGDFKSEATGDRNPRSIVINEGTSYERRFVPLVLKDALEKYSITFSYPSDELQLLRMRRTNSMVSMSIQGISTERHDEALKLLETISNSIFFQISVLRNANISLVKTIENHSRIRRKHLEDPARPLTFPRFEYEKEVMSLYWYASSASHLPLLQYLAYYQAMEYVLPVHSKRRVVRSLRNLLKNPSFNLDRDADLGKLIAVATPSDNRGFGDERTQLRATIDNCVNLDNLKWFIESDNERKSYFQSRVKSLNLDGLQIGTLDKDIRNDVSDRIYSIRCKIVHTKSGYESGVELLLPFSEEAASLGHEIELIRFVCTQVIVASSKSLRLP